MQKKGTLKIVLLAAGSSSRLGRAKQLLPFRASTLVQERVQTIHAAFPENVDLLVVTGARRKEVLLALKDLSFTDVHNSHFAEGMSTSIKVALKQLDKNTEAVMFLLVDQPFINEKHLKEMAEKWTKNQDHIVAATYLGITGVPAIFPRAYFESLRSLTGDQGARKILMTLPSSNILSYALPEAGTDIDTLEDLKAIGL